MTRSKKLRVLRDLYARVPEVHCKGLCTDACGPIPMGPIEKDQLEGALGRQLVTEPLGDRAELLGAAGHTCELLVLGRCTAYDQRPSICRVYGAAEGLRCPHGCVPDRVMSRDEARRLFDEVADL